MRVVRSSSSGRRRRALIIGVKVKETSRLTMTATAAVMPNWIEKAPRDTRHEGDRDKDHDQAEGRRQ